MSSPRSLIPKILGSVAVVSTLVIGASGTAHALVPPAGQLGQKGELVVDQVSGFRMSTDGNLSYYGPIGFSVRSVTERDFDTNQTVDNTLHRTTFWLAPSADIFVIDHLSVGGLIEFSTTSSSLDVKTNGTTLNIPQPTTTNFTFMPRVGWMFPISEKFGIWPRAGLGFISRQTNYNDATNTTRDTLSGFMLDLDVGFLFRFSEGWFLKAAPELSVVPAGGHSQTDNNGVTRSADASVFQFAGVTGIGIYLDL